MNSQTLAKFDPFQAMLPSDSSTGFLPVYTDEGFVNSTVDFPEQYLWYPGADRPPVLSTLNDTMHQGTNDTTRGDVSETMHPDIQNLGGKLAPSVVSLRRVSSVQNRFVLLQKWEGTVLRILDDSFIARLVDLTNGGPDEEAGFPFEEVPSADQSLVEPGAIFYWNIGYVDSISGQRTRASVIRFRRLPVWRAEELEKAKHRAQRTSDLLDWK